MNLGPSTKVLLLLALPFALQADQDPRGFGKLDATRAFFYPNYAGGSAIVLAESKAGRIDSGTYLRYLATRVGTRYLEDLAFEVFLERECKARNLARAAPVLARSKAAQRFMQSGRKTEDDVGGGLRRKFINEALHVFRVGALVRADRQITAGELRSLFERRYGVGGKKARLRQVVVRTKARALALLKRVKAGESFAEIVVASRRGGDVTETEARRYGAGFALAVDGLAVGELSAPVKTRRGYHLVEVVGRTVTRFEDVEATLRAKLMGGPATTSEEASLRRVLLSKYEFELGAAVR